MELQVIQNKIYEIRGCRVMLDSDLAAIYGIETRRLKEQVKRNMERFPSDFMFELTLDEYHFLRSQIATLENPGKGKYAKYQPFAFTVHGVAMLSSVLRTPLAVQMNIDIIRAFEAMRNFIAENKVQLQAIENLRIRIENLERGGEEALKAVNDLSEDMRQELDDIYLALAQLAEKKKDDKPRKRIGF